MSADTIIWHKPNCSTSRLVLGMIRDAGVTPVVRDYQLDPPSRQELLAVMAAIGIGPRDLIRRKNTPFDEMGLGAEGVTDQQLLDAMVAVPLLIERPVVISPRGTRLCRPPETVLEILPPADAQDELAQADPGAGTRGRG